VAKNKKHPSFGIIGISRIQGHRRLFGSDLTHHQYLAITISTGEEHERYGVAKDQWPGERIIEVFISEAQFGRMISSLNLGGGIPCTIGHVRMPDSLEEYNDGRVIPEAPREDIRKTQKDKIKEVVNERLERLTSLTKQLADWRSAKHRPTLAELSELINVLQTLHLASNFAYFQETMEESMEETISEGRIEFEAQLTNLLKQVGLDETHRKLFPGAPHEPQKRLGEQDAAGREDLDKQEG
jgi:hypothetical protein